MSLLDRLAAQANRADNLRALIGTVTAVNGDRTVDLATRGSIVPSVPLADLYVSPGVGDVVFVTRIGSAWLALTTIGKVGGVAGGPNLLPNPGFENGALGGVPSDWTVARAEGLSGTSADGPPSSLIGTGARSGDRCVSVRANYGDLWTLVPTQAIPVKPGTAYRLGFWVKTTVPFPAGSGIGANLYVAQEPELARYPDADWWLTASSTTTSVANRWTYVEGLVNIPAGPTTWARFSLGFGIGFGSPTDFASTIYFDDLSLRTV